MAKPKIVIIGAGVLGQGLAEAIATAGHDLTLIDLTTVLTEKGVKGISDAIDSAIARWGLTKSDKKAILSRISTSTELSVASEAEIVLEAVHEDLNKKIAIFKKLDEICHPETVFITNTSTIPVSPIASAISRPNKMIGMHFLTPVTKIPLVEIVKGEKTDKETFRKTIEFAEQLEKKWIVVNEKPGYVTTRIIVPLLNEAMHVYMDGVASVHDIDDAMKLGFGFNIGPLALADAMGLDIVMAWMINLRDVFDNKKYEPCPILRQLVGEGKLGAKTRKGFYDYDDKGNRITKQMTGKADSEAGK